MSQLQVNIKELISFYDEDRSVRSHSNAIKTLAGEELGFSLLLEHFRREGVTAELLDIPCTTGQRKGPWLDGWIRIVNPSPNTDTYYQVEVKSWSFHGLGGARPLRVNCTSDELEEFKRRTWNTYWSDEGFIAKGLNKVLTPMKPPQSGVTVEPLACVWAALHPDGKQEAFFNVPLERHEYFQRIWVFSMSSFLRNLLNSMEGDWLTLDMTLTHQRILWLQKLFSLEGTAQHGSQGA